jgi:hypothetical protein
MNYSLFIIIPKKECFTFFVTKFLLLSANSSFLLCNCIVNFAEFSNTLFIIIQKRMLHIFVTKLLLNVKKKHEMARTGNWMHFFFVLVTY